MRNGSNRIRTGLSMCIIINAADLGSNQEVTAAVFSLKEALAHRTIKARGQL